MGKELTKLFYKKGEVRKNLAFGKQYLPVD